MVNHKPLIILDRDGILNKLLVDPISGITDSPMCIKEIEIFPWVPDALKELSNLGFGLAVATNQPAAAKNKVTYSTLHQVHHYIIEQIQLDGAAILSSHICWHRSEDLCSCRKPKTGLLQEAFDTNTDFTIEGSWMVGDRATDIIAGHTFQLQTAWLGPVRANDAEVIGNLIPSYRGNDLRDFVEFLQGK
jgi:D-glycero-D-manno-heptose 1,7-bisphosphate phosphatase